MPRRTSPGVWLRGRWLAALLLVPGLLALPASAQADGAELTRSRVEAAYLFKFTDFVSWPEQSFSSTTSPIIVAVVADDALARDLELAAAGKRVQGRPLRVRRIEAGDTLPESHVLFIGAPAREHAPLLLEKIEGRPVLTVSNDPQVHAQGTMVNFVVEDKRVRFDVALRRAQNAQLPISALMLTAARNVAGAAR